MTDQEKLNSTVNVSGGVNVNTQGDASIQGDVIGRDRIVNINVQAVDQPATSSSDRINSLSQSIFARLKFLDTIQDDSDADDLEKAANDLVRFIETVPQGSYFARRIGELTRRPDITFAFSYIGRAKNDVIPDMKEHSRKYQLQLRDKRAEIHTLVDELLHVQ